MSADRRKKTAAERVRGGNRRLEANSTGGRPADRLAENEIVGV